MSIAPNQHQHFWHERFGLTCCKKCGMVRRADDKNKPCRGPVRVGLRTPVQGIEARQGGNGEAGAVHESPVGAIGDDAPEPQSDTPS